MDVNICCGHAACQREARDTALRVIAAIEADRDAEVVRLGGWERVRADGMLNNWIGGFTAALATARAALGEKS